MTLFVHACAQNERSGFCITAILASNKVRFRTNNIYMQASVVLELYIAIVHIASYSYMNYSYVYGPPYSFT